MLKGINVLVISFQCQPDVIRKDGWNLNWQLHYADHLEEGYSPLEDQVIMSLKMCVQICLWALVTTGAVLINRTLNLIWSSDGLWMLFCQRLHNVYNIYKVRRFSLAARGRLRTSWLKGWLTVNFWVTVMCCHKDVTSEHLLSWPTLINYKDPQILNSMHPGFHKIKCTKWNRSVISTVAIRGIRQLQPRSLRPPRSLMWCDWIIFTENGPYNPC